MTNEEFTAILRSENVPYSVVDGAVVVEGGNVYLPSLTMLPDNAQFNNRGDVSLPSLTILADNAQFNNGGFVRLHNLTMLPDNAQFNNRGYVYLPSLTILADNAQFNNGGYVSLHNLTILADNAQFNNGGYVSLPSLTMLPDNAQFNNGGDVRLPRLTTETVTYRGQEIRLRHVDDYTMLIVSEKVVGDYHIARSRYFGGGPLNKLKSCYVAQRGDYSAHGDTVENAIRDCRFKHMQANLDVSELVESIKEKGVITFDDFRLLTGACAEGLRHGLEQAGLESDLDELPLADALAAAHGPYGEKFREAFI